jgi:hypothetical protein
LIGNGQIETMMLDDQADPRTAAVSTEFIQAVAGWTTESVNYGALGVDTVTPSDDRNYIIPFLKRG